MKAKKLWGMAWLAFWGLSTLWHALISLAALYSHDQASSDRHLMIGMAAALFIVFERRERLQLVIVTKGEDAKQRITEALKEVSE